MSDFTINFLQFLQHYGAFGVFGLLTLGVIALPVPDETLLLLAGTLVKNQQLWLISTWFAVITGAMMGISVSYFIGRTVGYFAFHKLCTKIGLSEKHLTYTQTTFKRIGPWLLFFGFFIPGVRHFTGIIAGTIPLPYKRFALFAYTGALVWSNVFFGLGYFYGMNAFNLFMDLYRHYGVWLIAPVILCVIVCILIKKTFDKVTVNRKS